MDFPRSFRRAAFALVTVVTGLALCLGPLEPVFAQTIENPVPLAASSPAAVTIAGNLPDAANSTYKNIYTELTRAGVIALTNALQLFLGQMAYDAAEYIATGGKGQGKLFFDGKVGEYLANVGSNAAGEFMGSLSDSSFFRGIGVNLCQPRDPTQLLNLQVSLGNLGNQLFPNPSSLTNAANSAASSIGGIAGGLANSQYSRPTARCDFQAVVDNYSTLYRSMSDGDVIRNLEQSFDPGVSQLGSITGVYNNFLTNVQRQVTDAAAQRQEGGGFRPVEGLISGNVRTPASVVQAATNEQVVRKPGADQSQIVGTMLTNAWQAGPIQLAIYTGSIFLNTLASKFMQRIFETGLGGSWSPSLALDLSGPDSVAVYGKTDARNANIDLKNPPPQQTATYDVVSQMQTCLPSQRGAWNCVMDQSLVQAIRANTQQGGVTVRDALSRGMLHKDWRLIPETRTKENQNDQCYTQAYCATNLQKMRLMRILPIGFEFAANSDTNAQRCDSANGCVTLDEVVQGFGNCNNQGQIDAAHPWCHLIDPNWVITSFPQQCVLSGYTDTLVSSKLPIRKEECQDIQTCLSRNDRGECVGGYGYCMAEHTVYRFSADVCPAYAASCRIYKDSTGQDVGYLRNTIDRAACDASNAGCLWYSLTRATSTSETDAWTAGTSTGERIYFKAAAANQPAAKKGLESCAASDEGCTRLYAFTPGKAALNLAINGSFESQDSTTSTDLLAWHAPAPSSFSTPYYSVMPAAHLSDWSSESAFLGNRSLRLPGIGGTVPQYLWQSVDMVAGRSYSVSAYARSVGGPAQLYLTVAPYQNADGSGSIPTSEMNLRYHTSDVGTVSLGDRSFSAYTKHYTAELSTDWTRYEFSFVAPSTTHFAYVNVGGVNVFVDGVQLEEGEYATPFVETYSSGMTETYMKVAPDELMCNRPPSPRDTTSTRSALCDKFATACNQTDAGCQSYQDQNSSESIPAILSDNDLCPASCVGYSEYRKAPSSFDLVQDVDSRFSDPTEPTSTYFIPNTAGQCTQQDVGCEAFTLTDNSGSADGGTAAYSYLRACEKPGIDSETYFTWEGADTVGYQLRTWSLKRDVGPFDLGPRILTKIQADQISFKEPDSCNEANWKTAADPDCRQFYDARGRIYYRYFSQTILSTNDCTNLRLTRSSQADCEKTGGRYNERGECTYGAYLPDSRSCRVEATSCRMFTGASAGNTQVVLSQSFREDPAPFLTRGSTTSTEALLVGDVSLRVGDPGNPSPAQPLGYALTRAPFASEPTALYRATFWAKAPATTTQVTVRTSNENGDNAEVVGVVNLSPEWQRFTVGLFEGASGVSSTLLSFSAPLLRGAGFGFYFDEVSVVRVQDVVYVRNNTWTTPAQCDQGLDGADEPQAMLNCKAYTNRLGQTVNARRFTRLCQEKAIGCTAFVDTRNTDETYARKYVQQNPIDPLRYPAATITRPADRYIYLIDDPSKRCNPQAMSCRAFGKPQLTPDRQNLDPTKPYETVYYKDDINRYDSALCKPSEAYCAEYQFGGAKEYFRDPGKSVCEYRDPVPLAGPVVGGVPTTLLGGWYVQDTTSTPCYPSILEGGNAYGIARSGDASFKGYAGSCEQAAGECTELRDINDTSDPAHKAGKSYYYLKNDALDTSSCNGNVDLGAGCVLFRDMSNGALNYSAKASYRKYQDQGYKPVSPVDCRSNPEAAGCAQVMRCAGVQVTGTRSITGDPRTAYVDDADAIRETLSAPRAWTSTSTCRVDNDCAIAPAAVGDARIAYTLNVGGAAVPRSTSTQVVYTQATCEPPPADLVNDSNLLLKVSVDRECSEWLGCRSSETVLDPATNKYKEICSVPALCDKATGEAGDQFCASYVDRRSTSTEPILGQGQVLTSSLYASRTLGLGQKDYSGYAIPDAFQVMDLQSVRVAVDGAKNVSDAAYRLSQDYRLTAVVSMPPVQITTQTVSGRTIQRYEHTTRPMTNQAKVVNELNHADVATDGLVLTNPLLSLCKHVATGRIGYFIPSEALGSKPFNCYLPLHSESDLFDFDKVSPSLSAAAGDANNSFLKQAYPPAECRTQPEQDSPFPASFTTEWDTTKHPAKAVRRLAGFASANTCENGEDCSCTYKRVEYDGSTIVKFYNQFSQSSPPGICVGGPRDGEGCIPSKIFNAGSNTAGNGTAGGTGGGTSGASGGRVNAVNDASADQLCGPPEMGGRCMPSKTVTIVRGTFGQCLERDLSRTVGQNKDLTPCLTWNPTLLLNGDKDPYHYEQSAGYLPPQNSGQYYCISDARKPKSVTFNDANFVRSGAPSSGQPDLRSTPIRQVGTVVGRIWKFTYDDMYTSNGSGGSAGNWTGSVLSGENPDGSGISDQCEYADDDQDNGDGNDVDGNALRIVNTGRGANRQYTESFLRVAPEGFINAFYGGQAGNVTDPIARSAALSDNAFAYFGFSPIQTRNSTSRIGCGYNADWVDGLPEIDYDAANSTHAADGQWQSKFNADFRGVLTRSTEQYVTVPGDPSAPMAGRTILKDTCIPTTLPTYAGYTGQCYFKTWEAGYRNDGKTQFIGLGSGTDSSSGNITPGNRLVRHFEDLRTAPVYGKCDSEKPYFSIRAVFQMKVDPTDTEIHHISDGIARQGQWTFAGFWVTACGGSGSTDEHYIYMYPRAEFGDICTDVAEVVSRNSHEDAAFTDRVWKDGNFTLPVLGITYNARYSPFSSALNTGPAGKDPLFQTSQEVVGYSPLNPPTFLAAGYRTYYTSDTSPKDKWSYLTNIFARVYRIYRYQQQRVDVTDKACLTGPNKGKFCTNAGRSTECSLNGVCDTTRVANSATSDFSAERCNALSGMNANLTCLSGDQREACHLAPMQMTAGGTRLRQLPCLTQSGWSKTPDQQWSNPAVRSGAAMGEVDAAIAGAFRCPGIPASLRRSGVTTGSCAAGGDAYACARAFAPNGGWDASLQGAACLHPTDQDGQLAPSVDCPERVVDGLHPTPAAPAMTATCFRPTGTPATTPGKCRISVPDYNVSLADGRTFPVTGFSVDPSDPSYAYGSCFRDEECTFTQDNYYQNVNLPGLAGPYGTSAPQTPVQTLLRSFSSSRALWNVSWRDASGDHSDFQTRPSNEWDGGGGANQEEYVGAVADPTYYGTTGKASLDWGLAMYENHDAAVRAPGLPTSRGVASGMYLIGSCVNPAGAASGGVRTSGVCVGGSRDGASCSTASVPGTPNSDCIGGTPEDETRLNNCGPVVTADSNETNGYTPVPQCQIDQSYPLPPSHTAGVDLNNDNNMCTHEQGYMPRLDLCPNPVDEFCGLIAYNVRRATDSVLSARAPMPTDVTLGLHKLSYLTGAPGSDASGEAYKAFYPAHPPTIAAPDMTACPSPGKCGVQAMNSVSLNGSSEGQVSVAGSQAKMSMRFYAWADHNQMPLRTINIDWGDGQKQSINDGKLKNHKPYCGVRKECVTVSHTAGSSQDTINSTGLTCNTNADCPVGTGTTCQALGTCKEHSNIVCSTDQQCRPDPTSKDTCQIRNFFGNSPEACEENYFEFTHLYTCGGPTTLPLCRRPGTETRTVGGNSVPPASVELTGGCYYGQYDAAMMNGRQPSERESCTSVSQCYSNINRALGVSLTSGAGVSCVSSIASSATNANHCERDPSRLCSLTDPATCAPGDRCLANLAPTGGCWDDQAQICRFTPKVMAIDNWGWCTGECRTGTDSGGAPMDVRDPVAAGTSRPVALHPYGGCYSAISEGGTGSLRDNVSAPDRPVRFDNECLNSLPSNDTANNLKLRPWVVYPGSINLRSNQ